MSLKLYCNRYTHFKDAIVCSVACAYRTRCRDFALFYDARRAEIEAVVKDYYAARAGQDGAPRAPHSTAANAASAPTQMRALLSLEVKRTMPEAAYIWIGKDDQAELLEFDEVIRRAERGAKPKNIYKVAQEMELRFQLVPRKRIEKVKRAVAAEAERAAARSRRGLRPVPVEESAPVAAPLAPAPTGEPTATSIAAPRARRTRAGKVAGGR